jgi:hypothetical protein
VVVVDFECKSTVRAGTILQQQLFDLRREQPLKECTGHDTRRNFPEAAYWSSVTLQLHLHNRHDCRQLCESCDGEHSVGLCLSHLWSLHFPPLHVHQYAVEAYALSSVVADVEVVDGRHGDFLVVYPFNDPLASEVDADGLTCILYIGSYLSYDTIR